MKILGLSVSLMAAGLLLAAPSFAQTSTGEKQKTDGNSPTTVGPASGASKQRTDGNSPTMVGPGSAAFKQRTQSFAHPDGSPAGVAKQD